MKKLSFLLPALLIAACGGKGVSQEQPKAEALVKTYLKDSSGYLPLSFDTLRVVEQPYIIEDPEGRKLDSLSKSFLDSALAYRKKGDEAILNSKNFDTILLRKYQTLDAAFIKKSDSIAAVIADNSKGYQSKYHKYTILHTYDLKDNVGHTVKHTSNFWLDEKLTKVEKMQEAN